MSSPQSTEPTMTPIDKKRISRAAAFVAQAVCLLRIVDTPECRDMALQLQPFVEKVEKIA